MKFENIFKKQKNTDLLIIDTKWLYESNNAPFKNYIQNNNLLNEFKNEVVDNFISLFKSKGIEKLISDYNKIKTMNLFASHGGHNPSQSLLIYFLRYHVVYENYAIILTEFSQKYNIEFEFDTFDLKKTPQFIFKNSFYDSINDGKIFNQHIGYYSFNDNLDNDLYSILTYNGLYKEFKKFEARYIKYVDTPNFKFDITSKYQFQNSDMMKINKAKSFPISLREVYLYYCDYTRWTNYCNWLNSFIQINNLPISVMEYKLKLENICILDIDEFENLYLKTFEEKSCWQRIKSSSTNLNIEINKVLSMTYIRNISVIEAILYVEYNHQLSNQEYNWLHTMHYYFNNIEKIVQLFATQSELNNYLNKKIKIDSLRKDI